MDRPLGLLLIVVGLVAIGVGLLALTGALSWFGRLPGDLRLGSGRTRVYVPITSMLIVSVVLSVLLSIFLRR